MLISDIFDMFSKRFFHLKLGPKSDEPFIFFDAHICGNRIFLCLFFSEDLLVVSIPAASEDPVRGSPLLFHSLDLAEGLQEEGQPLVFFYGADVWASRRVGERMINGVRRIFWGCDK